MNAANNNELETTPTVTVDLERLTEYLAGRPCVVAATVFGSASDGKVQPGSDLDLAILFETKPEPQEFLQFYSDLCDEMPRVQNVDVVILNDADPILAFEAISGRFLCKNNLPKTAAFFSLVCREYEDVMGNLEHQQRLRV